MLSRQKVSRVCLIVISMVVYGLTPGALGQTPGGAVPKEDPWQLVQTQQTPISFEIPKAADRQFGGPVAQVDAFELDIEPRLVDGLGPELVAELRALIVSKHRDGPATG
ncbi:MAG: hypothetical protein O7G86_12115, partial [Gammaproteobacteria bacterium]|nr:hypothetical protein [Gammaproteobacteria bacterium]